MPLGVRNIGAGGDQRHPVADVLEVGQDVRRDQDGDAVAGQALEQLSQLDPGQRVEPRAGLVEERDARGVEE